VTYSDGKAYVIQIADRMEPGEKHSFPKSLLENAFASEIAEYGSLEAGLCSCLFEGAYSAYTLEKDVKSNSNYGTWMEYPRPPHVRVGSRRPPPFSAFSRIPLYLISATPRPSAIGRLRPFTGAGTKRVILSSSGLPLNLGSL
jgi:hypothetical protein